MKKIILTFFVLFTCAANAQTDIYWRSESPNGNWEWGSNCDQNASDGNWYYAAPWYGNRKRPDCYAYHYLHFDNNSQTTMELNSNDDFSVNKIIFEAAASGSRTINSSALKKIFFKGNGAKLENYSSVNHTINVDISLDAAIEINPINGGLSLNNINTFGYAINVYGNNNKELLISGAITGTGNVNIKQSSTIILSGNSTYTGSTTVEAGTLQLNNTAGALPSTASVTVNNSAILKISKNQTLANVTLQSGATLLIEAGAALTITGSLNSSGTITNNGELILQGSSNQNFPGEASTITALNMLTINTTAVVSLNKNISPLHLKINRGTFNTGAFTANSTTGGSLTLASNATLIIGGLNTLPANYATHSVSALSTVEYNGANQEISALNSSQQYGNLILSGTGQKTLQSTLKVAHDLTLTTGAQFTVSTGKTLYIGNKIINNATAQDFVIENNAALVQTAEAANTGAVTVIKNSNNLYRLDYTLWSAPVSGQAFEAFSAHTAAGRFYEYGFINGAEHYITVPSTNTFDAAKGYLIRMPNSDDTTGYNSGTAPITFTGVFAGTPHSGTITTTASTVGDRYTAVGNPYPSPISVTDFFEQNIGTVNGDSGVYLWRKRNNAAVSSYGMLNLSGYVANTAGGQDTEQRTAYTGDNTNWLLAQGQGFLVKTKDAPTSTNITFTNSMRRPVPASGSQAFFRSAESTMSRFWINISDEQNGFSQAMIAYSGRTTLGIDYGYDGEVFNDGGTILLYSVAADKNLSIQARPAFAPIDAVPMGYKVNNGGQFTITLDHTDGLFEQGQSIYLKDNLLGITRNLVTNSYSFASEAGTFNDRFTIVYSTSALGIEDQAPDANTVMVYKEGPSIKINSGNNEMTGLKIFDIRGRQLYSKDGINASQTTITGLQAAQQILIIKLTTAKGTVSKKIVF